MFGFLKHIIIYVSIILGHLIAQCDSTVSRVNRFNDNILEFKFEKFDKQHYLTNKSELGALLHEVENSDCSGQKQDSLLINLYNYFSENVAKINGDLMEYRSAWDKINLICDSRLKTVDSINTGSIEYYSAMKNEYESNQYWLENNYADLVIVWVKDLYSDVKNESEVNWFIKLFFKKYGKQVKANKESISMDNSGIIKNEMGVVKNELNNEPIKIHIQPPASIRGDFDKVRRLEYIRSEFELDFSTYDPKIGFIKKINDLPVPDPENENVSSEEIFESYALTFDDSTRYRVELNEAGQFDTLRIKPEKNWVLYNEVPNNIVVINIPNNLQYQVIDSKSLLSKEGIRNDYNNQVIIRNGVDENVEIVFQKRTRMWIHVAMRSIAVTVFLITPLFLLGG